MRLAAVSKFAGMLLKLEKKQIYQLNMIGLKIPVGVS